MPVKSVLDIDVNDEQFKAFSVLFDKYQTQLGKTKGGWGDVNKEVGATGKGFQSIAAALLAQNELVRRTLAAEKEQNRNVREQATLWQNVSRSTRDVAGNIGRATTSLLKWTALTSVFSGLLGAGGLFGIDRLASGVSSGRRSSTGLGIGYGEQKAFDTNFGRLVDTGSFMSSVNEAMHDVTKRVGLYGAGIGDRDLAGKNSAQVGSDLLSRLKKIVDATPDQQLAQVLQSRNLDQFIGLQDAQRLKGTSGAELRQLQQQFGRNTGSLSLDKDSQKKWQDFDTQLDLAGKQINNVFIKGIAPLIDPLNKLSESVTRTIGTLLASPHLVTGIKDLGDGIQNLASYLGKPEFQSDVKDFVKSIGVIASATVKVARWLAPGGPEVTDQEMAARRAGVATGGALAKGGSSGFEYLLGNKAYAKPGAGVADPGLDALAGNLQKIIPGLNRVTSFKDDFHAGRPGSAHNDGRAFDITVKDPSKSGEIAEQIRAEMRRLNITGKVIDEYKNPSSGATGGHLHVQADSKVKIELFNSTGGNPVVSTSQVAQ